MKVRIRKHRGELQNLSPDKVYTAIGVLDGDLVIILDDVGARLWLYLPRCSHLGGGSWEIVND